MNEVLALITEFLNGERDVWEFSFDLEDALINNYDQMLEENAEATEVLNDNLPDICAECEPGMDPQPIIEKVRAEYEKALALLV